MHRCLYWPKESDATGSFFGSYCQRKATEKLPCGLPEVAAREKGIRLKNQC
ncbi:hypothetical protein Nmel_000773 [Mimus melanotis]